MYGRSWAGAESPNAEAGAAFYYDRGERKSKRKAQMQSAAAAMVLRTYEGSIASRGPSCTARQI